MFVPLTMVLIDGNHIRKRAKHTHSTLYFVEGSPRLHGVFSNLLTRPVSSPLMWFAFAKWHAKLDPICDYLYLDKCFELPVL